MGEVVADVKELPKAIVRRVVKDKLSELSENGGDITVHKDALLAFSESARIFIHYLSATANEICKDSKRQTINADDVLKAIDEIEFPEFAGPLKASLEEFRKKNAGKRARAAKGKEESNKKKKKESPVTTENGEKEEDEEEEGIQDVEDENEASENDDDTIANND